MKHRVTVLSLLLLLGNLYAAEPYTVVGTGQAKCYDNRAEIENQIRDNLIQSLANEKLDGAITISQVLVRQIVPAQSVVESANALVRAKNELLQKEVEVKTAEAEARRLADVVGVE